MPTILLETALSPTHIYISRIPNVFSHTLSPSRYIFRRWVQTLPDILICLLDSLQKQENKTNEKTTAAARKLYEIASLSFSWSIRTVTQGQVLKQYSIVSMGFPQGHKAKEYNIIIIITMLLGPILLFRPHYLNFP